VSQPSTFQPLTGGDVDSRISAGVGCAGAAGGYDGQRDRVILDYLRHHLGWLGMPESPDDRHGAVHVLALLAAVRRQLGAWLPVSDRPDWAGDADLSDPTDDTGAEEKLGFGDLGLRLLRRLAFLGEAVSCGDGYYLPGPLRLVPLPSGAALVVAGLPTGARGQAQGTTAAWAGICRAVPPAAVPQVATSVPRQPLPAWLELPDPNLIAWTDAVLRRAGAGLRPSAADACQLRFEVYAPGLRRGCDQRHRWVVPGGRRQLGHGLSLCRTEARPYRFWLAPLEQAAGGVIFRQEAPIEARFARRLMYGLDQRAGAPVHARIDLVPRAPGERELVLFNWPAWEELRLLHALAADVTPFQKQSLPLRFRFAVGWWPDVRWALDNLHIRVEGPVPG
jgi:hypothetical protein